jgi:hypothetical protein
MSLKIRTFFVGLLGEKPLILCLLCAVMLSLPGINWGVNECWNLDQMGHLKLREDFMPSHYLKPPLHTYMNHILVLKPVKQVLGGWFRIPKEYHWPVYLLGSRILTLAMYCGFLVAIYFSLLATSGRTAAFLVTIILATSSGVLVFNRFLTADSPLLFWMCASFAFALRAGLSGSTVDAVIAGLLAGLAMADKYNGLGVAAAIPCALLASQGWRFIFKPAPWLAALAIPAGFVLGNPGSLMDTQRFVKDFLYNYLTTPVYNGSTEGTGYLKFLACFPNLIGWPASILLVILLAGSAICCVRGKIQRREWILLCATAGVFGLYFVMIGKFPRMLARFVLPSVPFILLLAAPALARINWRHFTSKAILGTVVCYNIYASIDAGLRFAKDPRMEAVAWVSTNVPVGATIENSYAPDWRRIPEKKYNVKQIPAATGRTELFTKILGNQKTIREGLDRFESRYASNTFQEAGLASRKPDFVAFTTQVFEWSGDDDAQRFYAGLDREEFGYAKVFEKQARERWPLSYPVRIDFLVDRMVILKRQGF